MEEQNLLRHQVAHIDEIIRATLMGLNNDENGKSCLPWEFIEDAKTFLVLAFVGHDSMAEEKDDEGREWFVYKYNNMYLWFAEIPDDENFIQFMFSLYDFDTKDDVIENIAKEDS